MRTFIILILLILSGVKTFAAPVKIAIIDTGMDISHPYLKNNIWKNPGETGLDNQGKPKETNGLDDDGNGFIDDIHGWNFAQRNPDISDVDGHGTHVSGIIMSAASNSLMNSSIEFIILKYYETPFHPHTYKDSFFKSMKYAVQAGADIINISGGGSQYSLEELAIFQEAEKKGALIVAAAGNKSPKSKDVKFYPAAYDLPNIISVVATDSFGNVLSTSNINHDKRNVFISGLKIYSSLPGNQFGFRTGSSQAAALFTGKIASYFQKIKKTNSFDLYSYVNNLRF